MGTEEQTPENDAAYYPATPRGRFLFALHWCAWKVGKALYRPRVIPPDKGDS